jgi:hypothetical protein
LFALAERGFSIRVCSIQDFERSNMSDCEKGRHLIGAHASDSGSESVGCEAEESSTEVPHRTCDYRPCEGDLEFSGRYRHGQERCRRPGRCYKDVRSKVKRICGSFFTIGGFTYMTLFASVGALVLLFSSTTILCKRPYPWRMDLISMVLGVMSTATIVVSTTSYFQ